MISKTQRAKHEKWLLEVTGIPTAAGCEARVVRWIEKWVKARKGLQLQADASGNLLVTSRSRSGKAPVYFTAHLDHPAFVVVGITDNRTIEVEFRGGVHDPYFENARVDLFDSRDGVHSGSIVDFDPKAKPFKRAMIRLTKPTDALRDGDVGRWAFRGIGREPTIRKGLLHTPACDDLAAVAAALSALDVLHRRKGMQHAGILFTLAEEVGFIGAIDACRLQTVSKRSRLICLENSRSFADSPIGAGPIVRVGDRMSVFAPDLTNRISDLMMAHQKADPDYAWQRKLMAGGACEATVFSANGYQSTCLCLPLGNYHNMADIDGVLAGKRPAKTAPEVISIDDYHGLIEMLIIVAREIDQSNRDDLGKRLATLRKTYGHVLNG